MKKSRLHQKNYHPYEGDGSFLAGPTETYQGAVGRGSRPAAQGREQAAVSSTHGHQKTVAGIVSHRGYIDNATAKETIVGLQTDKPLKRALRQRW